MNENAGATHVGYRSSVTGNFVTEEFATAHPDTTYKDTLPDRIVVVQTNDAGEDEAAHRAAASAGQQSQASSE